jgi:thiol-disulfide isomerase/thioredoxin
MTSSRTRRPGQPPPSGTGPAPARPASARWIIALVGVAVLAAIVLALISTNSNDSNSQQVQTAATTPGGGGPVVTAPVTVNGTPLPILSSEDKDPAVGMPFPEVSGTQVLNGQPLTIPPGGSRPKLVFYIAHWCPHCQREVPLLQSWIDQKSSSINADLFAVSTGVDQSRGNYPPAAWLTKEHWSVPTLADSPNDDAARAAGLGGYPFFVAVDKNGKVVKRFSGERSIAEIEGVIASMQG